MVRIVMSMVVGLMVAGTAAAAPGDHVRVGDVEFVPDVDLGVEYRTNVYRHETTTIPAGDFRIAPGLLMALQGDDHQFEFSGEWILRKYFFVSDDELASPLPSSERIGNLDRFDEFSLAAGADTFRRNVVGFRISEEMALVNFRADAEFADVPYSSQLRNVIGAGIRINPGPALEIVPGGQWTYDSFRIPGVDGSERALNSRNQFGPVLNAKWAFLPRTSLVGSASWMVNQWEINTLESGVNEAYGAEIALPNSNHIKTMVGVDGRFTEKLFAQLMVGYGVALYNEDSVVGLELPPAASADATGADGFLLKSQLRYTISPSEENRTGSSAAVGYVRDFKPSFFTNYIQMNQLFLDYLGRFGDFQPGFRYEVRFEDYHGEIERHDIVNRLGADVQYNATDWAAFTAGGWWQQRASTDDLVEYDDFNLHALATFVY